MADDDRSIAPDGRTVLDRRTPHPLALIQRVKREKPVGMPRTKLWGQVYAIENLEGPRRIKIGFSHDTRSRFKGLADASPVLLRIVRIWEATNQDEWRILQAARAIRIRGEWCEPGALQIADWYMSKHERKRLLDQFSEPVCR